MRNTITKIVLVFGLALFQGSVALASTAAWPQKPVRLVVPFSPGGVADALARLVGQELSSKWKQTVVVENVVGAGGNIGMAEAVRAPADGYTMILAPNGNLTMNQHLFKKLPLDLEKDLAFVTILADSQNVLVVSSDSGIKTLDDLLKRGKESGKGLSYGSPGIGSTQHLAGALLGMQSKVKLLHIPYKGFAPAINDVIGGNLDMVFVSVATAAPFVESKRLVPLAISGKDRATAMPGVPSITEIGFPDFEAVSWYSLVVRAGTDRAIQEKMHRDISEALKTQRERILGLGLTPSGKGLDEFAALARSDSERWGKIIQSIGIEKQ